MRVSVLILEFQNARIESQQFFDGEKFIVIGQLGKITDALAGDWLAGVDIEQKSRAAGGIHVTEQHVHGGGLARAIGAEKPKTSPVWTLRVSPFTATLVCCFNSRERYSTRKFSILRTAFIRC